MEAEIILLTTSNVFIDNLLLFGAVSFAATVNIYQLMQPEAASVKMEKIVK